VIGLRHRWTHPGWAALPGVLVLLLVCSSASRASAGASIECQHPVMTGVEIYKLHDVTSHTACPLALALFRWENRGDDGAGERALYGCHGIAHPYLRLHSFHGWHLALTPDFVMSRDGASFAVTGTDFPINCT
jgi:hypothetical protein